MRIINNADILNLLLYAKKNLGIYVLIYKKHKLIYYTIIISTLLSIIFLICFGKIFISKIEPQVLSFIFGCLCFLLCIISLVLIKKLNELTKKNHLKIQKFRYKKLKKYYSVNKYSVEDIICINELLIWYFNSSNLGGFCTGIL